MFNLIIKDVKGVELELGNIVKVKGNYSGTFYTKVKYLENQKAINPFHTFSFHSIEKVNSLPDDAIKSLEKEYDVWYVPSSDRRNKENNFEDYHKSWRSCEVMLSKGCFHITKQK